MTTTNKFETGASTHAVNDLILFTDNTRELAELRDSIYLKATKMLEHNYKGNINQWLVSKMVQLFSASRHRYYKELAEYNNGHIANINQNEMIEYCSLYAADFNNWKLEHGYK